MANVDAFLLLFSNLCYVVFYFLFLEMFLKV